MKTTIVIPTYNEKDNIIPLTDQIFKTIPQVNILIVDDNSPDGTGYIAGQLAKNNPQIKVMNRLKKEGLGRAYIEAFQYLLTTDADYIIEMDADFSHDPKYLPDLLNNIKDYDVVVGSRFINGISITNWPLSRLILSVLANRYSSAMLGLTIKDSTSGFVCYKSSALKQISLSSINALGYAFQIEMKYRLFKKGFRIDEVPIVFTDRRAGCAKMSYKIIFEAIFAVLRLRLTK